MISVVLRTADSAVQPDPNTNKLYFVTVVRSASKFLMMTFVVDLVSGPHILSSQDLNLPFKNVWTHKRN